MIWYLSANDKLVNLLLADLNTFGGVLGLTISTSLGPDIVSSLLLLRGGQSLSNSQHPHQNFDYKLSPRPDHDFHPYPGPWRHQF